MQERALETKVGFFLLAGLATIAAMIIIFGRFQESLNPKITITVEFPNAQGLLQGTTVTLAGSPIGRVKSPPMPIQGGAAVAVPLSLQKKFPLREGSKFSIVAVGMLGDKAIDVQPDRSMSPEEFAAQPLLEDGAYVQGLRTSGGLADLSDGLAELATSAKPTMLQLNKAVTNINSITSKLDSDVVTPEMAEDLKESIKKLRSVLTRVDALLAQAQQGKGPLAKILNDRKMAEDLTSFVSNIRRKGILFYSDIATRESEEEAAKKSNQPKTVTKP